MVASNNFNAGLFVLCLMVCTSALCCVAQPVYQVTPMFPSAPPAGSTGWTDEECVNLAGQSTPAIIQAYWNTGSYITSLQVFYNNSGQLQPCTVHGTSSGSDHDDCTQAAGANITKIAVQYDTINGYIYGMTIAYTSGPDCSLGTLTVGTPGTIANNGQVFGYLAGAEINSGAYIDQLYGYTFVVPK